jgi:hypothetical protein
VRATGRSRRGYAGRAGGEPQACERLRRADNLLCLRKPAFRPATTDSRHRFAIYVCGDYIARLKQARIAPSMSRAGCPWDNAMAESFIATLKREEVDGRAYRDIMDARAHIGIFLEPVYNQQRLHSALGYQPPDAFEAELPLRVCA